MSGRRAALFGRLGATFALLLFAALVAASGLDRMSQQSPALARLVPQMLRAEAARSSASQAIARGRSVGALGDAQQAVAADPVHPASTSLLGTAYLLAGDEEAAERAFRVAARFGWREGPTQLYWYEAAIQSGDMARAVDRADALLRVRPAMPERQLLLAPLESSPDGRAALVARLADRPAWLAGYLRPDERVDDPELDRRSLVLTELAGTGMRLGCDAVAPFVSAALARGARGQAEGVWLGHCPGSSLTGGLADGNFEQLARQDPSPFGWRVVFWGDVAVRPVETSGEDWTLRMRNRASVSRLVLRQALSLEPGTYRLTGKATPGRVAASLGCGRDPPVPSFVDGDVAAAGQLLRAPECSRLELGVWLRPGTDEAELDDLRLEKIG